MPWWRGARAGTHERGSGCRVRAGDRYLSAWCALKSLPSGVLWDLLVQMP